jgi:RHS repeat-associated protein
MVYVNDNNVRTLESTNFGGGRINKTDNNMYDINYFITDHLGSTRVIVDNAGNIKAQYNYYPFGKQWEDPNLMANTNRYTFSGKEKQTVKDLGFLDFGARMLETEISRWFVIDPLAEKYYSVSPYVYCLNNPLKYVDPTGMYFDDYFTNRESFRYEYHYNASPAFDRNGNFLGTDDEGYSGNILIFDDPAQFYQGMPHGEAMKKGQTLRSYSNVDNYTLTRIINHVINNTIFPDGSTLYSSHFFAYRNNLSKFGNGVGSNGIYLGQMGTSILERLLAILDIINPLAGKYIMAVDLSNNEWTVENLKSLAVHEIWGHGIMGYGDATKTHYLAYEAEMNSIYWNKTTESYKHNTAYSYYHYYYVNETGTTKLQKKYYEIVMKYCFNKN